MADITTKEQIDALDGIEMMLLRVCGKAQKYNDQELYNLIREVYNEAHNLNFLLKMNNPQGDLDFNKAKAALDTSIKELEKR
jgi:gamma-glutamyl:cysteine ligase YbdK (ATP-grasp superfamily)